MSTTAERKMPRTTMMPVTTMEEVPILSDAERAQMLASLKEAEAQIAAGERKLTGTNWLPEVLRRSAPASDGDTAACQADASQP